MTPVHGGRVGGKTSPEYVSWLRMRARCEYSAGKQYVSYGGRGIVVCERWRNFKNFLADMGRRPSRQHSIDRIDNNGNYEPGNCRWATLKQQGRNRRSNVLLSVHGETLSIAEWAERAGLGQDTLTWRLKHGWPAELAIERRPSLTRREYER